MSDIVLDYFVILAACITADLLVSYFQSIKNKALDIGCDFCKKAIPLSRTPDKVAYLCRTCMVAYFKEHDGKFTDEQIYKAKKAFRRIRRKSRGKR